MSEVRYFHITRTGKQTPLPSLGEAAMLTGQADDETGCRQWAAQGKIVVLKRGAAGCRIYASGQEIDVPGFKVEDVDPTGAGDSFAGGMFGYLAKTKDNSWNNLKRACVAGSVLASFSVEKLGTKRLQEIKPADINRRTVEFKKLTSF